VRVLVAVALVVVPAVTDEFVGILVPLALTYAVVVGVTELARRRSVVADRALVSPMLLVDAFVLAVALSRTGGYRSPLLFLVFLQVAAVTLLVSLRAGLKFATWCALLLLLAQAAGNAGVIEDGSGDADRHGRMGAH